MRNNLVRALALLGLVLLLAACGANTNIPSVHQSQAQLSQGQAFCEQDANFFDLVHFDRYVWPSVVREAGPSLQSNATTVVRCSVILSVSLQAGQKITTVGADNPALISVVDPQAALTTYFFPSGGSAPFSPIMGEAATVYIDLFAEGSSLSAIVQSACARIAVEHPTFVVGFHC